METRKNKKMWIFTVLIGIMVVVVLFLSVPISPTTVKYSRITSEKAEKAPVDTGVFTEDDISGLPLPVQCYFTHCGYLGKPKMSYMRAYLEDVDFVMSQDRTIKIDYEQFNLVERPERFALISSTIIGIPFEGLDSYENGKGSMRGCIAKVITLFDQRGESMNRACLITWLAECLFVPSAALQDFVKWEPVDDTHAKATVTWKGVTASGIFTFSEAGEMLSFRTGDRMAIDMNGNETQADWSAFCEDYREVNGILQPRIIKSVWHYEAGDCVYFNANESKLSIQYN
jgi:hypothetical protein